MPLRLTISLYRKKKEYILSLIILPTQYKDPSSSGNGHSLDNIDMAVMKTVGYKSLALIHS